MTETIWAEVAKQVNQQIAAEYHTTIEVMKRPAQGDFHWYYKNINDAFNLGTFNYINAAVSSAGHPDQIQITGARGYLNAYVSVLQDIEYVLNEQQTAQLQIDLTSTRYHAQRIRTAYQQSYGEITKDHIQKAGAEIGTHLVATKLDFIIQYILGFQWSGSKSRNLSPIGFETMTKARQLDTLFPEMPASGAQLLPLVMSYFAAAQRTETLQDEINQGNRTLRRLIRNTNFPTPENGGVMSVDPVNGALEEIVRYNMGTSIVQIQKTLRDTDRKLTVILSDPNNKMISSTRKQDYDRINPLLDHLLGPDINTRSRSLFSGVKFVPVKIEYPGYIMIGIDPEPWKRAGKTGWYFPEPIDQAIQNYGTDASGYVFSQLPSYAMGTAAQGGNFGRIIGLLISAPPQIFYKLESADTDQFITMMSKNKSVSLDGTDITDQTDFHVAIHPNTETNTVTVAVKSHTDPVLPVLQQTAHVIGASVAYFPKIQTSLVPNQ